MAAHPSTPANPSSQPPRLTFRDERVFAAVKAGKISDVRKAVKGGKVNLDAENEEGGTPLLWAMVVERMDIGRVLVDAGAERAP